MDENDQAIDYKCFLRCTEDGIQGCGDECNEKHADLEDVNGFEDPNFVLRRLPLLARYVSNKADCFIKHLIQDRVQNYDFWMEYEEGCVFLVGNLWLNQYETVNVDIASGKLTSYLEVAEQIEKINISSANPPVPTAALNMDDLFKDTRGTVKNLDKLKDILLEKQTSEDIQGFPSLVSFFPKHKGLEISNATRDNAAHLLQHTVRERPIVPLEEILGEVNFEVSPSEEGFKFAFSIPTLSPRDMTRLYFEFLHRTTTLEFTEDCILEQCREIAKAEQEREKKKFETRLSPILLYDAFQNGRSAFQQQLSKRENPTLERLTEDNDFFKDFKTTKMRVPTKLKR